MKPWFNTSLCLIIVCLHPGYGTSVPGHFKFDAIEQRITERFEERIRQLEAKFQRKTDVLERQLKTTNEELLETKTRLADVEKRLEKVAAQNSTEVQSNMTKRIVPQQSGNVAFSAHLSTKAKELGLHHIIPFDTVYANVGNAFDPLLHVFTCPESGVYIFMTAIIADLHQNTVTEITKNGVPLVQAYSAGSTTGHGYDQGFNSVVTSCDVGDRVWVQIYAHQGTTALGGGWCSFSGYRLF